MSVFDTPAIRLLEAKIVKFKEGLSKHTTQEMSEPPLTDEKLEFWGQRKALADSYYQLGAALEREGSYQYAVRAYWDSYQINQNESVNKKLGIINSESQVTLSATTLLPESDLPPQPEDCFYLGLQYLAGLGHPQNNKQAAACFERAAEQGLADAQSRLGLMYNQGRGVPEDATQAMNWWQKAAEQGEALAQNNLGFVYDKGRGVPQDETQAVHWYQKAAEQGEAFAQDSFGWMYYEGRGVPQDATQTVHWVRIAAEQGLASAQHNLGMMYAQGRGVPRDDTLAVHWYRKAAEQGLVVAQHNLGGMYYEGRGVPQDDTQAVHWWRKAAEQEATAQTNLRLMYEQCRGPIQPGSAKQYRRDYKNGINTALNMLKICKNSLKDFKSRYHYAVENYNRLTNWIIGSELNNLIKQEPNEMLEAIFKDKFLLAAEREELLGKIFAMHRRDINHSNMLGFFRSPQLSKLTDENYGKLCYYFGSQLYETQGLRGYPEKITAAKAYYSEVPNTSSVYRHTMSELYDLETIKISEQSEQSAEAIYRQVYAESKDEMKANKVRDDYIADQLGSFYDSFFKAKGIAKGHIAMDAYDECNAGLEEWLKKKKLGN